jgi:uncharacterized protein (DUF433 family)
MSVEEILDDYDDLEHKDILATFLFAARLAQAKSISKIAMTYAKALQFIAG